MEKAEKRLTGLVSVLNGGADREIAERIKLLRSEEPFSGALRSLAIHFDKTDNQNIKQAIAAFFNDLKEKTARAEVIDSISVVRKQASKSMIISSCWQSGLDYSDFALQLAGHFIEGDYMTSLECFTVFDNCATTIGESDRAAVITMLQEQLDSYDTPKQKLATELITLLKG
jgi:hypothetical protein